jgi:hypothetical protein
MAAMAKFPGLVRGKRKLRLWTVRVVVPAHLREIIGRKEIWKSTGAGWKNEAKKKYPLLRAEIAAAISAAERLRAERQRPPTQAQTQAIQKPRKVSETELHVLVRAWFHQGNHIADQNFQTPISKDEHSAALRSLDEEDALTRGTYNEPGIEDPGLQQIADRFIEQNGMLSRPAAASGGKSFDLCRRRASNCHIANEAVSMGHSLSATSILFLKG